MINFATFREALHGAPIVPVLTVPAVEHAAPLATALIEGGLRSAEVTLRTPVGLKVIEEMKNAQPDLIVGAGTICSEGDVDAALKAGADFLVSPGASPDLLKALSAHDGVILPGVATASEAMTRFEEGFGVQKFFPAEASGGANFLKSLAGPLPHIDFMPTGGVKPHNAMDYLSLPNVIAAGGTWIALPEEMDAGDWTGIEAKVREAAALGKGT
ncbi:MAG: bifunctional 4-hydroxy-2-oxoglutarate aldolase/2-dehydro-3-deoxy-phosphogluconate aldolase [Pseudomonadota bacterium]|jgi:2-dehydro-3-deoxyphosphogluconate aldolase/(4S)-4-hydroxy-2-oxoglutarate aldolase|nr:bifunctional 4-hydroxy-2-oxoglutarate aldolase/2-dehydro-3-deoxy-phosphogluconate aldolase [Pseudomonadota bacterium]